MSLISEIEKLMCETGTSSSFRFVNIGGKSIYVEGIKNVVSLSENEMQFQLKNKLLVLTGLELKVKYLDLTTCVITGDIKAVETK